MNTGAFDPSLDRHRGREGEVAPRRLGFRPLVAGPPLAHLAQRRAGRLLAATATRAQRPYDSESGSSLPIAPAAMTIAAPTLSRPGQRARPLDYSPISRAAPAVSRLAALSSRPLGNRDLIDRCCALRAGSRRRKDDPGVEIPTTSSEPCPVPLHPRREGGVRRLHPRGRRPVRPTALLARRAHLARMARCDRFSMGDTEADVDLSAAAILRRGGGGLLSPKR